MLKEKKRKISLIMLFYTNHPPKTCTHLPFLIRNPVTSSALNVWPLNGIYALPSPCGLFSVIKLNLCKVASPLDGKLTDTESSRA